MITAEGVLQLRVLEQVVEHDLGDRVALEHDHEPLPGPAAGLVAHVGNPGEPAVLDQLGDLGRQVVRVDLERELLTTRQLRPVDLFVLHDGAHGDGAAPGPVGLADAAPARRSARESGSRGRESAPSARRARSSYGAAAAGPSSVSVRVSVAGVSKRS